MTGGLWLLLFRFIIAFFQRKPEPEIRDPEILLQQAQEQMRERQARNRERAVQAITQKNILQAEHDKTQRVIDRLQEKASSAEQHEDKDLAQKLFAEAEAYQPTLAQMGSALERAVKTTELIKEAIRCEEEQIRAKTAQVMAMKTQWKHDRISTWFEETAAPQPTDLRTAQGKLTVILKQVERTREALWQEAQAAMAMGDYTMAVRLLAEQQDLENVLALGQRRV